MSMFQEPSIFITLIKAYNIDFHFEVKVLLKQKFRLVNTFQCTKPWNLLLWNCLVFFFLNYTCIYNRKFMRFIILQLDEFTCTIYPTVLFFFYRFSSWPWLVWIIPDQQIPLWFVIISVKSTPHSFKPFHLKLFRIYYITLDLYR